MININQINNETQTDKELSPSTVLFYKWLNRDGNKERFNKYVSTYSKKRYANDEEYKQKRQEISRLYILNNNKDNYKPPSFYKWRIHENSTEEQRQRIKEYKHNYYLRTKEKKLAKELALNAIECN
jgi:hypothetical protein